MVAAAREAYLAVFAGEHQEFRNTWETKENLENGIKSFITGPGATEEQSETIQQELYIFSPPVLDIPDLRRAETKRSRRNLIAYWHKSLEQEGTDEINT